MATKQTFFWLSVLFFAASAQAAPIAKNTARLQAMDKITGTSSVIEIAVNSQKDYEDFSIVVRECKTNPPEETPESFAFVDIAETSKGTMQNIYKGWMISSSPALNPLEHPMYDLWLLECVNAKADDAIKLNEEELALRDELNSTQDILETAKEIIIEETPEITGEPESILGAAVDTKIEFNAIEEEKKQALEAEKAKEMAEDQKEIIENDINIDINKDVLNLLETKEPNKDSAVPNDAELEANATAPVEEVVEEAVEEKSQLIDFSGFSIN